MSPAHLSVIGGAFLLESVVWYTAPAHCPEFGGCPLFRNSKFILRQFNGNSSWYICSIRMPNIYRGDQLAVWMCIRMVLCTWKILRVKTAGMM